MCSPPGTIPADTARYGQWAGDTKPYWNAFLLVLIKTHWLHNALISLCSKPTKQKLQGTFVFASAPASSNILAHSVDFALAAATSETSNSLCDTVPGTLTNNSTTEMLLTRVASKTLKQNEYAIHRTMFYWQLKNRPMVLVNTYLVISTTSTTCWRLYKMQYCCNHT